MLERQSVSVEEMVSESGWSRQEKNLSLFRGTMDHLVWLNCGGQGSGLSEMRPGELNSHLINYVEEFA